MADTENGGMLSQADLDALIASAGASDEEEAGYGGFGEEELEVEPEPEIPTPAPSYTPPPSSARPSPLDLPSFDTPHTGSSLSLENGSGLGRVRDIPLDVSVELGRTRLLIRDILDLATGSIIELDKIAGEPVDLFANGMLVARGEVIVIDDNFGVRVTEIITAGERSGAEKDTHARAA